MDESEIPIDIHASKLLDWLISRRHVPRDFNKRVGRVKEKINEAINDMPVDEKATALLSGSWMISHIKYSKSPSSMKWTSIIDTYTAGNSNRRNGNVYS